MTLDLAALREAYKLEYPTYVDLVERAKAILEPALTAAGLEGHVEARAKEVYKVLLKAVKKHREKPDEYADPLTAMGDKGGLRLLVAHLDAAEEACSVIEHVFVTIGPWEHTADRYAPDQLGYLGIHGQACIRDADLGPADTYLRNRDFEVQVHTRAQNAWSTVSHPLLYKPPGGYVSPRVASKVYRAVALASLFDEQVVEARREMMTDPNYRPAMMLDRLHREFAEWVRESTDDELSLQVLPAVALSYADAELERFGDIISDFVAPRRQKLDVIYTQYSAVAEDYPLLFQPESLAIYERLNNSPEMLRQQWIEATLPLELLESLSTAFGVG